jgi:ubiquinone/menaquinone biosynthesis C-methylase UbiE
LDYSKTLTDQGKTRAQKDGLNTVFVQNDARATGLPGQKFKVIIVMGSSLGYFVDECENDRILREAFRLLMPKGLLLLDLPNREHTVTNFAPESWHEANEEIVVCRQRRLDEDEDIIYSREMVISKMKGMIRDATYSTRLYSPEKITTVLRSVGFNSVTIKRDFVSHEKREDYGLMTNRMIVIAEKE